MKTISRVMAGLVLLGIFAAASAEAQVVIPPTAKKFERRGTGSGGTNAGVAIQKEPAQQTQTVVILYTTVTKAREWTNADGKNMMAQLVAYSAPAPGETGPVEIIKEGKIRFLITNTKKPIEYPLDQLSQPDQIFVKAIAQSANKGVPKSEAEENGEGAKTSGEE